MVVTGLSPNDPGLLVALEHHHSLSADDYHRMIEAGIFGEDDRLELIEGVIVEMSPRGPRHARVIQLLCDPQFARLPDAFVARCQLPLTLGERSEPEPDVSIVRRADASRGDSHPRTATLIFEVAAESLRKDRVAKAALYAAAGIAEYVVVNLDQRCLEIHRDPDLSARRYRTQVTLPASDRFESAPVPGFAFEIASLFE